MGRTRKRTKICAICGRKPAATVDHVPPKGIFPKPKPNLITVPACLACNNGASKFDERFKVFLSLHVTRHSGPDNNPVFQQAFDTLQKNRKLKSEILEGAQEVYLSTPAGIVFARAHAIKWDSRSHDEVIERTIRGLYFHHYGQVLGDKARVKVQWLSGLDERLYRMSESLEKHVIGRGQVVYVHLRPADHPLHSLWIFQFFGNHWASGYSEPIGEASAAQDAENILLAV